jgi:branched-chain amino acid transport system substrate-binding protein
MSVEATEFARKELAQATRSLVGAGASLHVRRIALATCDDNEPEHAARAAQHLVDDVGVPAILGFRSGQEVVDLTGSLLVRRGVVSVATLTSSPLITRLPQPPDLPRMVWRTTMSLDDVALATSVFVRDQFEPRRPPGAGRTRVALVRWDAPASVSFGQTLLKRLVFNGKSAVDNGGDYQDIAFTGGALQAAEASRVAARVAGLAPAFVILLGPPPALAAIATEVEARWKPGGPRPTYFVAIDDLRAFAALLGTRERRARMFSIESTSTSAANAQFVFRYNEAHHERQVSRSVNYGSAYDAFYLLAYGVFALGNAPVTGPVLARAFGRLLPPGLPIDVGPAQVFEALAALAAGGQIDLDGTNTALDFNLATGEAPSDFALECAGVDSAGNVTGENVESGLVYRAKTRAVEGTMACP